MRKMFSCFKIGYILPAALPPHQSQLPGTSPGEHYMEIGTVLFLFGIFLIFFFLSTRVWDSE